MKKQFGKTFVVLLTLTLAVMALIVSPVFAEEEKDSSIVHFWPLDNSFEDVISGLDFYCDTEEFADGAYSGSGAWDSTYGGHGYTDPENLDLKAFTVSLWFFVPETNQSPWNALFSSGYLKDGNFIELYYSNGVDAAGIALRGSVGSELDMYIAKDVELESWHHMVLTYNSETNLLKGYIDGEFGTEKNVSSSNFTGFQDAILYLGHEKTNYVFGYSLIDDVIFATREFSAEEVKSLYKDPAGFARKYLPEPTATPEVTATPERTESVTPEPTTVASATELINKPTATSKSAIKNADEGNNSKALPFVFAAVAVVALVVAAIVIIAIRKKKKAK
jgi:hypothetical protein